MKKIFNKLLENFKDTKNIHKKDIIIFSIILVFLFTCFIYWDLLATTSHTVNFIEVISQGKIFDFYKINYEFPVQGVLTTVCYEIPIYFVLMVWDLPLWIVQHFFKVDIVNNFFCLVWMKGIVLLFLILCSLVIKKICEEIGIDKKYSKWASFIFLSSPLVLSSTMILSQYDVIPIFFMLLGIFAYIRNDHKKFLLWFAIAIPMKLFSLFAFIPLVLLKEKKVVKIIGNCCVSVSILAISKIISGLMPYYSESTLGFNNGMIDKLLNSSLLNVNLSFASLFVAAYVGICIFCYIKNLKDKKELEKYSIYIPFVVFVTFFLFVSFYPYWIIYLIPFFVLVLFLNTKFFKVNILLEMVLSFATLVILTNYYNWCFGAKQVNGMLISQIFGEKDLIKLNYPMLSNIYMKFPINTFLPAFFGVYLAISIALIIINFPVLNKKQEKIKIERSVIWVRMLLIVPFALLMIFCYFS